jgi:hypothetical protein
MFSTCTLSKSKRNVKTFKINTSEVAFLSMQCNSVNCCQNLANLTFYKMSNYGKDSIKKKESLLIKQEGYGKDKTLTKNNK